MLIAQEKKESNIAEYLLYMWQLEDLFRAHKLNEVSLKKLLIDSLKLDEKKKDFIWNWYKDLLNDMRKQGIEISGHRSELVEIMNELTYLHQTLINVSRDPKYLDLYAIAKTHLDLLKSKSANKKLSDIEVAMNGLYGLLLLRLKKSEISDETQAAMATFSKMIAYLAATYHKVKNGGISLPGES